MGQEMVAGTPGALALEGGTVRNASDECSAALWQRLKNADDAHAAAWSVSRVPALAKEVREVLPRLLAHVEPASDEEIVELLLEAAVIYGIPDRSDAESATMFRIYLETLSGLPIEALRLGMLDWNKAASYFPKPGELHTRALVHATNLRTIIYRAKRAAEFQEKHPTPMTPEERAASRQKLIDEGLMTPDGKMILTRKPAPPPRPPARSPQEVAAGLRAAAAVKSTIPPPSPIDDIPEAL